MINLIYGAKGSGKTKKIIDAANACAADAKGDVVYITDNDKSLEIGSTIRFINVNDYDIHCKGCLVGFLKGMIAANSDNNKFYIDGIGRILNKAPDEMEELFKKIEEISDKYGADFTLTISAAEVPKFMKRYL